MKNATVTIDALSVGYEEMIFVTSFVFYLTSVIAFRIIYFDIDVRKVQLRMMRSAFNHANKRIRLIKPSEGLAQCNQSEGLALG